MGRQSLAGDEKGPRTEVGRGAQIALAHRAPPHQLLPYVLVSPEERAVLWGLASDDLAMIGDKLHATGQRQRLSRSRELRDDRAGALGQGSRS